jgi:hypothetical protein
MGDALKRFGWVAAYAVAMALLEAVVVVYLRGLLRIGGETVSLGPYATMEIAREAATLVMLVAVGWLAGQRAVPRLAYGLFAFGLWDIAYYGWLRVLIGWPETLLDRDVLFLIPLRWWGPVLAPVLIALLICVTAVLAVVRVTRGPALTLTPARVGVALTGALLALYVFMADALHAWLRGDPRWTTLRPTPFRWPLFLIALALMALPSLRTVWPRGGR